MSLQFEWPWALLLLPLPLLIRWLLPAASQLNESALRSSFASDLQSKGQGYQPTSGLWPLTLAVLFWLMLVLAAMRPQLLGEPRALPVSGRDLMLAVDVSGSMRQRDFIIGGRRVTRLDATKAVAGDFIRRREGDRVGLILFGRQAYLNTPLTFDRVTVNQLLQESFIGIAGSETAIGDAIGLAIKRLRENNVERKTLILLTDGANTAGAVDPLKAAELAAVEGLTIYTLGIGSDGRNFGGVFGGLGGAGGGLDERVLQKIADLTGGQFFRARNAQELSQIYALLDELEPASHETSGFRPTYSLYYWPLGFGLLLGCLLVTRRFGLLASALDSLGRKAPTKVAEHG